MGTLLLPEALSVNVLLSEQASWPLREYTSFCGPVMWFPHAL